MTKFSRLLALRKMIRSKQHLGMSIRKSDDGNGWIIGQPTVTPWSLFTIYIDQTDGWSFFHAVPDIAKGINIEDEKLIVRTNDLYLLGCRWESEWHIHFYGPPSTKTRDTWEGKMMQATCLNSIDRA